MRLWLEVVEGDASDLQLGYRLDATHDLFYLRFVPSMFDEFRSATAGAIAIPYQSEIYATGSVRWRLKIELTSSKAINPRETLRLLKKHLIDDLVGLLELADDELSAHLADSYALGVLQMEGFQTVISALLGRPVIVTGIGKEWIHFRPKGKSREE